MKRGDACVQFCDADGNVHQSILTNVLHVPSYRQDIFSVQAATSKGATVKLVASGTSNECGRIYTFTILLLRFANMPNRLEQGPCLAKQLHIYIRRKNVTCQSVVQLDIIHHLQC